MKKWGGLLVESWDDPDGPDKYVFFLPVYIRGKINQRRERLLRKWGKTSYFTKNSISDKWTVEFISLVPEDDGWHHVAASVTALVKKEKKKLETSQYIDGVLISENNAGERQNNEPLEGV